MAWVAGWAGSASRRAAPLAVAALVCSCTTVAGGIAQPATDLGHDPAPVPVAALDSLLLAPEQLDALLNTSGLVIKDDKPTMYAGHTAADDCGSSQWDAFGPGYVGSGWVAVRQKYFSNESSFRVTTKAFEAVVAFPLPVDAAAYYRKQVAAWPTCNDRRLDIRNLDEPQSATDFWKAAHASEHDGMLTMLASQEGSTWACQRALTVRNNIAVDVDACTDNATDQGETLATALAAKVPVS